MKKYTFTLASLFLLTSLQGFAASVKTVKGTQVLINTEGATFTEGQEIKARDADNKLRAILRVKKVGKSQAIAEIVKGKAVAGYTIGNRAPANTDADGSSSYETEVSSNTGLSKKRYGVLGSYLQNSMSANYSVTASSVSTDYSTAMKGTGFGVLGFYDFPFAKDFEIRAQGGLEQFAVSNGGCGGISAGCTVSINYLSMYGLAKYKLTRGKNQIWGGGGLGYLMAMSQSSTVLGSVTANQVFTLAFGADIALKNKTVFPVSLEYSIFPPSGTVSANIMSVKIGYGWGM